MAVGSWLLAPQISGVEKTKVFIIWPFLIKKCRSLLYTNLSWNQIYKYNQAIYQYNTTHITLKMKWFWSNKINYMNAKIFKYFTIWRWDIIVSFPSVFAIERFILIAVLWIDIVVMTWPRIKLFSLICNPLTPYSHNHYITSTILLGMKFAQINSARAETVYLLENKVLQKRLNKRLTHSCPGLFPSFWNLII